MEAPNAPNAPPSAVMFSIGEIAERGGVSKPTVSVHVKRLSEGHGLTVERDGQGRVLRVNVVEYDHLRAKLGDPSKAQGKPRASMPAHLTELNSYDEALRQKTWHEAEKRRIELDELKDALVRKDLLHAALGTCGEEIVRVLDRLPQAANDLSITVAKDGEHGLRTALKVLSTRLRLDVATALSNIAAASPIYDEDDTGCVAGGECCFGAKGRRDVAYQRRLA